MSFRPRTKHRAVQLQDGSTLQVMGGLNATLAQQIDIACSGDVRYEKRRIKYDGPTLSYTPDFELPNGIIIEGKGYFTPADRTKHLLVQQQHPQLDIRFVFSNPNTRLSSTSQTTYAAWCDKHGFRYAAKTIPLSWFKEKKKP